MTVQRIPEDAVPEMSGRAMTVQSSGLRVSAMSFPVQVKLFPVQEAALISFAGGMAI